MKDDSLVLVGIGASAGGLEALLVQDPVLSESERVVGLL